MVSIDFQTACDVISSLPWSEGFESATNSQTPSCWQVIANGNSWFRAISGTSYRHSGSKAACLYGGNASNVVTAVFPEFEANISTLALSFWYKCGVDVIDPDWGTIYGKGQIGYVTDPNDGSTFVAVGEPLAQSSSYVQVGNVKFTGAPAGALMAIRYSGGMDNDYFCLDDITVDVAPACSKPTGVSVVSDSETDNGATINWISDESAWKYQISEGDAASWGAETAVPAKPLGLSGLSANTLYYVRVKAVCGAGDESDWSDPVSFRTLCGTVNVNATTPWNIDFQDMSDNVVPGCWDNSASTGAPYWDENYYLWGTFSRSGNRFLRMDNSMVDGGTALINTPSIAIPSDGNDYELTFDYSNRTSATNLLVKISANGGAFTEKGSYIPDAEGISTWPGAFQTATVSLAAYSGQTIKVQFFANPTSGTATGNGAMFVDNISVHKVSDCSVPTALAASNLTSTTARVAWTAGGGESAWRLQYRAEGGSWSEEIAVGTNPQRDLTGLTANTTYFVRVKSYCAADDQSAWCEPVSFTTLCTAASLPFSESFSSASALPSCWIATPADGIYRWSAYEKSGAYAVQLRTGSSGYAELRMPAVTLSEDAILRFEWKNANGANTDLYISTDGGSSETLLPGDLSGVHPDWTTKIVDLSAYTGETVLLYFKSNFSTMNQFAYLDDVEIVARPCNMILSIQAVPTTGGATVSWSGDVKKLQYRTGGGAWTSVEIASANYAGPKTITGLTPARSYQVRLLPACSEEEEANWTSPVSFVSMSTESIPYSNDFEGETAGELPFNWSRISTTEYPQVAYDSYAYKEGFGEKGNSVKFSGVNDQILVLPAFDATLSSLSISFHHRNRACTMELGYVESDGITFHAIETLPNQTGYGEYPYERELADISPSAANLAIRYRNATGATSLAYVDNVAVSVNTCGRPSELAASDITATSAHLSWAASISALETQYQYIIRQWDADDPDWSTAVLLEEGVRELNLSTLVANTDYEFYLRSYCDETHQSRPVKVEFRTPMLDVVFDDVASATDNETRLAAIKNKKVNITINRPLLRNGDYCTLTLPFNLSSSELAAVDCPLRGFIVKEFMKSTDEAGAVYIYLNQVSSIEAGKPYFVRYNGTPTDERLTSLLFKNVEIAVSEPVANDASDGCTPHGVFNPYPLTGGDESTLFLSSNNTLYYPSADGTMNGFRAYIKVGAGSPLGAPIHHGVPIRIRDNENTATGMENVPSDQVPSTKVLRDGQLYIKHNGIMYNVQGQKVK